MLKYFWILLVLIFCGCASTTKQTDDLYKTEAVRSAFKPTVKNTAPFIEQKAGHCGPAVLTMAIQSTGQRADLNEITSQVYNEKSKGSLQTDMISASRRQGMTAIPISGYQDLLGELQAGHNVIVFENLAIRWFPQWHYALVTGYDFGKKTLTMHSGPKADEEIEMGEFELSWKLTEYWGLVVLKPGELSATASEIAHVQAAAAFEQINKTEEAKLAYLAVLKKWPQSLIAHIGLGNVFYNLKDYKSAIQYLEEAVKINPDSTAAKNNLAVAHRALADASTRNPSH